MASAARYRHTTNPNPPLSTSKTSPDPALEPATPIKNVADTAPAQTKFSVLDALRILGGLLILSAGMSYMATSGDSMTWGYNPWWTRAREWSALIKGEVHLTDTELLQYDGTDPTKPIYVALNGTIYDVSANPRTYGPGGSYHFFAGRDAARAFLTGCFQEDQTPDLRGVELMYMPMDPEEKAAQNGEGNVGEKTVKKAKQLTKAELKDRHARELRAARKQVREGLEHWHAMFRGDKGKPYRRVGEVVREKGWLEKLPVRELCKEAAKGRPIRQEEGESDASM